MKIIYLRLKGYAGIYHGMGIDEIQIDFTKFKSNIILIRGDNGCGKSTIMDALSIEIDDSEKYRRDMVYDESFQPRYIDYHAEKEIHFQDGQDIYKVLIISPVSNDGKRKTTKAFISLNENELNPNGNVSSFKDLKNSMLDMDPNYIALSHISSENRGLVDMIPSERKKFMSSVISTLDFYNNCYRALSKKSSLYRTNINNLKSKIFNIGDQNDIVARLTMMNNRLLDLDRQKEVINQNIAESKAIIKILDPDNKIQDLYTSILQQLEDIKSHMTQYTTSLESHLRKFNKSYQNDLSMEKISLERTIIEIESHIQSSENELTSRLNTINTLHSKLTSSNNRLEAISSTDVREDIEEVVSGIKSEMNMYAEDIRKTDLDINISRSELEFSQVLIENISKMIFAIRDNKEDILVDVYKYFVQQVNPSIHLSKDILPEIEYINTQIEGSIRSKEEYERQLEKTSILKYRPEKCCISDCYFIKEALEIDVDLIKSKIEDYSQYIDNAQQRLSVLNKEKYICEESIQVYMMVQSLLDYIESNMTVLLKLGKIGKVFIDKDRFLSLVLKDHYLFDEFNLMNDYIGMGDIIEQYKEQKGILIGYEADLKIHINNMTLKNSLKMEIEEYQKELEQANLNIVNLNKTIKFDQEVLVSLRADLQTMNTILEITSSLDEYKEKKRKLGEEFNRVKDDIASVKEKVDFLNTQQQAMELLNNEYIPLKDSIDQLKFNLLQLQSYQKELATISDQYEKIDFIKKSCNPSSDGIQKIYISMYMNTTIVIANELLSYLFGGGLKLLKPIVDDGFSIPFINEFGHQVSDISKGSTSQRCMFGMCLGFALLSQGSTKYNILRMDEIEGGLDTENRMSFMPVVYNIMGIMQVEQTFICSHNIEIDAEMVDEIHVSKKGLHFEYRVNI